MKSIPRGTQAVVRTTSKLVDKNTVREVFLAVAAVSPGSWKYRPNENSCKNQKGACLSEANYIGYWGPSQHEAVLAIGHSS